MISCPVCKSKELMNFIQRKNVPVHQNLLFSNKDLAIKIKRGDLFLKICKECEFIFNTSFDSSKLNYGENYDNTQDVSPFFDSYISDLADRLILDHNIKNSLILEIGCGKGKFLHKLVENKDFRNMGFGFDPSYIGPEKLLDGRLNFKKKLYDGKYSMLKPDVIICRHVIEHISDPISFLKMIKRSLDPSKTVKIFFETPDAEWILKNNTIYDFFYEHCSYFSTNSIFAAFQKSEFQIISIKKIFNEQYLFVEATNHDVVHNLNPRNKESDHIPTLALKFLETEQQQISQWLNTIKKLKIDDNVAIWGAGAKGVTFLNLIDPQRKLINSVIDINPNKQGKFIPGTGHLIIDYHEIKSRGINTIIIMNPNYSFEIFKILKKEQIDVRLIS